MRKLPGKKRRVYTIKMDRLVSTLLTYDHVNKPLMCSYKYAVLEMR